MSKDVEELTPEEKLQYDRVEKQAKDEYDRVEKQARSYPQQKGK